MVPSIVLLDWEHTVNLLFLLSLYTPDNCINTLFICLALYILTCEGSECFENNILGWHQNPDKWDLFKSQPWWFSRSNIVFDLLFQLWMKIRIPFLLIIKFMHPWCTFSLYPTCACIWDDLWIYFWPVQMSYLLYFLFQVYHRLKMLKVSLVTFTWAFRMVFLMQNRCSPLRQMKGNWYSSHLVWYSSTKISYILPDHEWQDSLLTRCKESYKCSKDTAVLCFIGMRNSKDFLLKMGLMCCTCHIRVCTVFWAGFCLLVHAWSKLNYMFRKCSPHMLESPP